MVSAALGKVNVSGCQVVVNGTGDERDSLNRAKHRAWVMLSVTEFKATRNTPFSSSAFLNTCIFVKLFCLRRWYGFS